MLSRMMSLEGERSGDEPDRRHLGTATWPEASEWEPKRHVLPVGPKHPEDPRLICDLLGHLGRKGPLSHSGRSSPKRQTLLVKGSQVRSLSPTHLVGVQAAALHSVAPEGQHAVLQTHWEGSGCHQPWACPEDAGFPSQRGPRGPQVTRTALLPADRPGHSSPHLSGSLTHSLDGEVKGQHRSQCGRRLPQQVDNPHAACTGRGLVGGDGGASFWGGDPVASLTTPPLLSEALTPGHSRSKQTRTVSLSTWTTCWAEPGSPSIGREERDMSHQPCRGPKRRTWGTVSGSPWPQVHFIRTTWAGQDA